MQLSLEGAPSCLESVHEALPSSACWRRQGLAGLCFVLSLHLFFESWPEGHYLWEAISGCPTSQSRSRAGNKLCPPLACCQDYSFHH